VPFGLTNALATFMGLMNCMFHNYVGKFIIVFINDILIYYKSSKVHKEHLCLFMQLSREHQLYTKLSKCDFYKKIYFVFVAYHFQERGSFGSKED
jgi:hypothetical protein